MEAGASCLLYQIECHKQVRHSPLIPVKQNLTRETLEYNTLRDVYWPGSMEVFSVLAIEQMSKIITSLSQMLKKTCMQPFYPLVHLQSFCFAGKCSQHSCVSVMSW